MKSNIFYIPIGSSCKPTWYLHKNGYRNVAFPFDWTVTPIESALMLLKNNFNNFLNKENLIFLPPQQRFLFKNDEDKPELTDEIITPVYDVKYNILYVHDFSSKGEIDFSVVKEKYSRRVDRLKELLKNKNNKIYFIYDNDNPNEWQKLQYEKVSYQFKKLSQWELNKLMLVEKNISFISLEDFKKRKEKL